MPYKATTEIQRATLLKLKRRIQTGQISLLPRLMQLACTECSDENGRLIIHLISYHDFDELPRGGENLYPGGQRSLNTSYVG